METIKGWLSQTSGQPIDIQMKTNDQPVVSQETRVDFEHSVALHVSQGLKSIDIRDRFYKTPLMFAAIEANVKMIRFFVEIW